MTEQLCSEGDTYEDDDTIEEGGENGAFEAKPRKSMRKAINEYCQQCIYDEHAPGNWRQQVAGCPVTKCPLWEFRPVSKPRKKGLELNVEVEDEE